MSTDDRRILAERLRQRLKLPSWVDDDHVLKASEGTGFRAQVELRIAIERLCEACRQACWPSRKRKIGRPDE
jgi:hypothetical protein